VNARHAAPPFQLVPEPIVVMSTTHQQSDRTLQDTLTSLTVPEVLAAATLFFARRSGVYTAFVEKQGPSHVTLRGQGGEEIAIGARATEAGTAVTGSSYLFDQQIARFLESLPPAPPMVDTPALPAAGDSQTVAPPTA
jgi:hypothetical protein